MVPATASPGLSGRSTRATFAPSAAKAAAIPEPSPPAAPVITTVRPAKRIQALPLSDCLKTFLGL